ncbi:MULTISPECIES: aldose epimerase family protein [unclassified Ruegeria]|uniref:aldose epimerase family protein n=1 Tax=unclassified Ruegeria TaxID=2625375 RepID=UPI001488B561|nr:MULTISPECIES: aldose epimerase family protein [unclassified Ruegeria]NOD63794.1 galactose mutarotase [Ruegeria sp. HKCCD6109]
MTDQSSATIERVTLQDGDMSVALLNYGAITQGWWMGQTPLILGYDSPQEYLTDPYYLGATVGRVANRISGARFDLLGETCRLTANEGQNTLHGGGTRLSRRHWDFREVSRNQAVLSVVSPDGDGGFPGSVRFELGVELKFPRLNYTITAQPDRPTPISIAQHNYYTLGCSQGILDCRLKLNADQFLELNENAVPTGRILNTKDENLDFSNNRFIGQQAAHLDHYFVFADGRDVKMPVAEVDAPTGLSMKVYSDQPGAQVYAAAHLSDPFRPGAALCIEPAGYTDAVNHPAFPSVICTPERPYHQKLTLEIDGVRT